MKIITATTTPTRLLCLQYRHYTECIVTEQVPRLHSINVLVYGDEQVSPCEVAVHTKTLWCGSWPAVQTAEADRAHGRGLLQHSRDGLQQRVPLGHVLARALQHLQPVVAACADEVGPDSQTAHQLVRADPVNIVPLILVHLEWKWPGYITPTQLMWTRIRNGFKIMTFF